MNPTRIVELHARDPRLQHREVPVHPSDRRLHHGHRPGNSVTNSYGQVWDTPNVFVTGAALFPAEPGREPDRDDRGAVTYRTAEALANRYFDHPDELLE